MRFLLVIVSLFIVAARISSQPVIPPPTQTDEIIIDNGTSGSADPNDRIRYTVTIQNTGNAPATLVQLNAALDGRTTLVPGSFKTSPLAINDTYTSLGNVGITVPDGGSDLMANDYDDNIAGLTLTAGTFTTTQGGSITINANGSFSYNPARGFEGTDTYVYTLNDGNAVSGVTSTNTGTVTITVAGMIWFINNNVGACASNCDGRLNNPYTSLTAFNTDNTGAGLNPGDNDIIFIYANGSAYTSGIVLRNGQKLFGQDMTVTLAVAAGLTVPTFSNALPVTNGVSAPDVNITNAAGDGVTMATDNTMRGFTVGNCSDFGMDNTGTTSVGNLVISEVAVNNTSGGGFDASNGSGTSMNVVFSSLTSNGGTNGIDLTSCAGVFTVNGGTITNPTATGVMILNGSVTFSSSSVITDNSGFAVDVDNHDSNNVTFSGNITSTGTGIRVQNCGGGTMTFSGASKSFNTGTNSGVTLSTNTGATITISGGGLVITTSSGTGFNATGGATAVNVTGTGNTINSSTGTAINVNATTIGSGNLNFQSITSTGAGPSAIILNTTGSSGGLIVTGTGSAGTGGTISNKTADGISLISTMNTSLSWMIVNLNNGNGIYGDNLTNFSLLNSSVTNNDADNLGTNESGLRFDDLWGTCFLTSSTVSGTKGDNIRMTPTSGTLTNFTISGSTIGPNPVGTGGNGLALVSIGSGSTTITVTGSSVFTGNQASGFLTTITTGTTSTININNSTFQDNNINVDLGSSSTGVQTINVSNNTLLRAATNSMNIVGDGQINGIINNNNIGNGTPDSGSRDAYDIAVSHRSDTHWNLKITNNTCKNSDFEGIFVRTGDVAGNAGSMDLTLTGNTVFPPDDNSGFPAFPRGIYVRSRQNTSLCLNIANNESQGKNGGVGYHLHRSDASVFKMQGFTTDGATTVTANGNKTNALAPTTDTIGEPFQGSCTAP